LLLGTVIAAVVIGSLTGVFADIITQMINRNLRRLVWGEVLRMPMHSFRTAPPGELISRITTDTESLGFFVMRTLYPIATAAYTTFAVLARLFEYDPRLSWAMLGTVPVLLLLTWIVGQFQYVTSKDVATRTTSLTERLAEHVVNIPLIKSFGVTARERQRADHLISNLYSSQIRLGVVSSVSVALFSGVGLLQTVVVIATGVLLLNSGDLTTQEWVTFFLYSVTISGIVTTLTSAWSEIKTVQGTTARIAEIVDGESEHSGDADAPTQPADLVFEDVSFSYGGTRILQNVSHVFRRGSFTVLVGPNGSGKSTLLSLVQRLHEPTDGRITLDGAPIRDFRLDGYRSTLSSAPQDVPIVSGTVRSTLLVGVSGDPSDERLSEALELGCGSDFLSRLPQGLDTAVGEFGVALSGGQRQRIALARALLRDSGTVLLDEPTAAMDATTTRFVLRAVREATAGRTVIMVAHTPLAVEIADEVVVLEEGRITGVGDPASLVMDNSFFRDLEQGRS